MNKLRLAATLENPDLQYIHRTKEDAGCLKIERDRSGGAQTRRKLAHDMRRNERQDISVMPDLQYIHRTKEDAACLKTEQDSSDSAHIRQKIAHNVRRNERRDISVRPSGPTKESPCDKQPIVWRPMSVRIRIKMRLMKDSSEIYRRTLMHLFSVC